ncbi:MAG TPA: ROK family protein [Trebonia sp.]|jgi:glucokinase|nr:ROK family protein [Trebonia sp.]
MTTTERAPSPVGAPPVAAAPVLALDVGATRIKAAVIAADGSRVAELRHPTGRADGPDAVLARITNVAATASGAGIGCAGLAVCGAVGPDGLVTAVNLGWESVPAGSALSDRLGVPVTVLNDAHAGALGEGSTGAARDMSDFLYVSLGTGIGAAIVKNGRVVSGAHGRAGELGHIVVDQRGPECACGSRGCLERFMSAAALESRWLAAHGSALTAREIIDSVIAREPAASALWDEAVEALAEGLLTAMSLIDPAVIVLGGGLSGAGARLLEPLTAAIAARARPFHAPAGLRLASLGDWSGCAGAAVAARDQFA